MLNEVSANKENKNKDTDPEKKRLQSLLMDGSLQLRK